MGRTSAGIPLAKLEEVASKVHEYLKTREVICLDRRMGKNPRFSLNCRLYVTKEFARLPYVWHNMLFEPESAKGEPDLVSIHVPEWPERLILVHPEAGKTYILGTDYFGEDKKSFLRNGPLLLEETRRDRLSHG